MSNVLTLESALQQPLIIDGGLGSELERNGCDVSDRLWSGRVLLDAPQQIAKVHRAYLDAGARVVITASYQVSFSGFAREGFSSVATANALRKSVELARRVRDDFFKETGGYALVAASVGPYGAALADGSEFHGNYAANFDDLVQFHLQRMQILASSGPDLLACETIPSLEETHAILTCLKQFPDTKAWFSFSCRDHLQISRTEPIRECARLLKNEPQVALIGINCTPPRLIESLIGELRAETEKPIVAYPNSGRTWHAPSRSWLGTSELEDFGKLAKRWSDAGATWIGGCCGTTPDDISDLHDSLLAA